MIGSGKPINQARIPYLIFPDRSATRVFMMFSPGEACRMSARSAGHPSVGVKHGATPQLLETQKMGAHRNVHPSYLYHFSPIVTAAERIEKTAHEKPLPGPRTRERLVVFSRRGFDSVGAWPRRVHKLLV